MVCMKTLIYGAIAVESTLAFAPSSIRSESSVQTALRNLSDGNHGDGLFQRRHILERTVAAALAGIVTSPIVAGAAPLTTDAAALAEIVPSPVVTLAEIVPSPAAALIEVVPSPAAALTKIAPSPAVALTTDAWAISIQTSTRALSQSLGHALMVIDGLNTQASRIGSSPDPAHQLAVLDGMNAQARRLVNDLDKGEVVLDTIKVQARELTPPNEEFTTLSVVISHASSVLDGLLAQSKRLVTASASGRMTYMLTVLDGLNAQTRRLDAQKTLSELDELNAKAVRAQS